MSTSKGSICGYCGAHLPSSKRRDEHERNECPERQKVEN